MFQPVTIAPSILSANFMNLGDDIKLIEDAGAGFVHVDVMDGHFVPNITMGVPVVEQLANTARIPLDVHLMISNPLEQVPWFLRAGADSITVHAEALYGKELRKAVGIILDAGCAAAVALRPETPVEVLEPVIRNLDMVLLMSVEPGFSGQKYIENTAYRVTQVTQLAERCGCAPLIQVDGGIGLETAPKVAGCGADVLVCGNAVYKAQNPAEALRAIQGVADEARVAALEACGKAAN